MVEAKLEKKCACPSGFEFDPFHGCVLSARTTGYGIDAQMHNKKNRHAGKRKERNLREQKTIKWNNESKKQNKTK